MVALVAVATLLLWSGVAAAIQVTELGDDPAGIGAVLPPDMVDDWTGGDGGSTAPGDDVMVEPGDDLILEPGDDVIVEPDDGWLGDDVVGGDDPVSGEDGATYPTDDYIGLEEWLEESVYASEAGDLPGMAPDEPRNFGERISSLRHAGDNTPAAVIKGMEVRGYQQRSAGGE
jgi:hypothetical protein